VAVVAIDAQDRVALVRQWRLPADGALLEIPAGGLDIDAEGRKEDPDLAARRELEEETGVRARTWRKLGEFYTAPGFTDELMHLYIATDLTSAAEDGRLGPDEDERLILEWRPWPDAVAAAERGEIRDAKSIVGLFWLERLRRASGGQAPAGGSVTAPATAESVTVTYRMTTGEAVLASVGLARRSIGMRLLGLLTVIVAGLGVALGDPVSIVGVVVGVAIATGWAIAPLSWWQFRKRPDLIGADTTLTADHDGVEVASTFGRGRTAWSTFRKVHDLSGFFLFDNDAGVSIVVPKRAFSPTQLSAMYGLLDRNRLGSSEASA
jgi:ADP-ribose pyrophosphatase